MKTPNRFRRLIIPKAIPNYPQFLPLTSIEISESDLGDNPRQTSLIILIMGSMKRPGECMSKFARLCTG